MYSVVGHVPGSVVAVVLCWTYCLGEYQCSTWAGVLLLVLFQIIGTLLSQLPGPYATRIGCGATGSVRDGKCWMLEMEPPIPWLRVAGCGGRHVPARAALMVVGAEWTILGSACSYSVRRQCLQRHLLLLLLCWFQCRLCGCRGRRRLPSSPPA